MPNPSPIDLATLQACKDWIGSPSASGDANIQRCLTAWSLNFLRMTGRGPRDWQTATSSPYNQPTAYSEIYDGNGNNQLFLRNFPVNSVSSLTIFGSAIPAQTPPGSGSTGYAVDNQGRSIVLVNNYIGSGISLYAGGPSFAPGGCRGGFPNGVQNVAVNYIAGFNVKTFTGQVYTITPAWQAATAYATGAVVSDGAYMQTAISSGTSGSVAPPWASQANGSTPDGVQPGLIWQNTGVQAQPNTVTLQSDTAILSDGGVKFFIGGAALTQVFVSPAAGQYFLTSFGSYLFNATDAGKQVLISYTAAGTPPDIVQASIEAVSLNYKRRGWEGVSSLSMKDVGQTTYTQFAMSKNVRDVVRNYTRSGWAN